MQKPFLETALPLLEAGYSPVPIVPGTKRPGLSGWQRLCDAPLSPDEIERLARSPIAYGVGVASGFNGLIAIDIDTDDAAIMAAFRQVLPSTIAKRGRRGCTVFGRDPSGTIRTRHFPGMVDILTHGSQTVLPPTRHPDGMLYCWTTSATLLSTSISMLPNIALDIADRLAKTLAPRIEKAPRRVQPKAVVQRCELSEHERERQQRYANTILVCELVALAAMASNSGRNQSAFRLVCRVGRWAHHGIVSYDRLISDIFDACKHNGLVRDDGRRAVLATIESALAKSAGDPLPDLGAHHG